MTNSNLKINGLGNIGTDLPTPKKQSPIAMKKIALRDVQNDNRSFLRNPESSCLLGGPNADVVRVSGTKRLTPECPPSPPYLQLSRSNVGNEHPVNACEKSDSEQEKRRIQETAEKYFHRHNTRQYFHERPELPQQQAQKKEHNTSSVSAFTPIHMASQMTFPDGGSSIPISLRKSSGFFPAAKSNHIITPEVPHSVDSEGNADQRRKERFIHLQKLLKNCDESEQTDYIQMLLKLSPAELSRHAFELEKRSIQLSVEEGIEIQRKQALNILGKSALTSTTR